MLLLSKCAIPLKQRLSLSPINDKKAIGKVKGVVLKNIKLANLWALCTLESCWCLLKSQLAKRKFLNSLPLAVSFCKLISKRERKATSPATLKAS